jgi:diguanylate cyclase (GGDEF)-like protein/PAS domain S-box-containing protein
MHGLLMSWLRVLRRALLARGPRQRDDQALLRSERAGKLALTESSLDAMISMDHEGQVIDWNPAAERMFGWSHRDAVGRELGGLIIPPDLRMRHRQGLSHYLRTGEGPAIGHRLELRGMRSDGTEFPVEVSISRVNTPGPPVFTGFVRDITERKEQEDALRQYARRLEGLREIDRAILAAGSLRELVTDSLTRVQKLIDSARVTLTFIDFDQGHAEVFAASTGTSPEGKQITLAELDETLGGGLEEIRQGRVTILDDIQAAEGSAPALRAAQEDGFRSLLLLPLLKSGELIGALSFASREPGAFDQGDVEVAREVADQLSIAIQQARLHEEVQRQNAELEQRVAERTAELKELSLVDELTGVSNRRALSSVGNHELKVAARAKRGATLLFVDVDGLKRINDEWGHAEGDRALQDAARLLQESVREADLVARVAGDEFCVLLTDAAGDSARRVVDRLDQAVLHHREIAKGPYTLSISVGSAGFDPAEPVALEELMREADRNMYEQKKRPQRT